jgi:hypothetical protein
MIRNCLLAILTIAAAMCGAPSNEPKATIGKAINSEPSEHCTTLDFHYLQTENVLYSPLNRHVEIFMDEKAFTEKNLHVLFEYLSKQNSEPVDLTVDVKTNWNQLQMPSNCPGGGVSGLPPDPHRYDYLQAIYYRRKDREYFKYSPAPHIDEADFKTVILKKN